MVAIAHAVGTTQTYQRHRWGVTGLNSAAATLPAIAVYVFSGSETQSRLHDLGYLISLD